MYRHLYIMLLSAILLLPNSAARALDPAKVDAVTQAADSFVALAKDSHKTGRPPRASDASAKSLLDIVLDTAELERGPPVPWTEVQALNNWTTATIKVGLVYFLAGTGVTDMAELSNNPQAADKANRNTVLFAPEWGRYTDAQLHLQGAIVDALRARLAVAPHAADDPAFASQMARVSGGVAQAITGALGAFVVDGVTDAWRLQRLAVILKVGAKTMEFIRPNDRQQIQNAAAEVANYMKDPSLKSTLKFVAQTFAP